MKTRLLAIALSLFAVSLGVALTLTAQGTTQNWVQVNPSHFGDPTNTLIPLEVFDGQLYAGASNWMKGGQVWRTADYSTWTQVSEPGFGNAYTATNAALIDMIEFHNQLYVSTGWGGTRGQIWRSPNGTNWTQVEGAGFGDPDNTAIATFVIFSDTLYVSTHGSSGLEIWRSSTGNNGDWARVVDNGKGDADNRISTGLMEFDGCLYAAVENEIDGAEIWRTANGITWTAVMTGGFGSVDNSQTGGFAILGGYLYIGTFNDATGAQVWRSNNGTNWDKVVADGFGDINNSKVEALMTFDGALYAGTHNAVTGIEVWRSPDGLTWTQVNVDGFGNSANSGTLWSVGTVVFNGHLHITSGGEIWLYLPNFGWIDNFDSPTLDPRWTWAREDPTHWSLTDHPGFLRITTQEGSLRFGDNTGRNVLVTWPNLDNFQIETKVTITPAEVAQNASLFIYQDDDNFVQIGRYYAVGGQIRFRVEVGGQQQSQSVVTEAATTVYLRLAKFNNFYSGSYSTDGSNWIEVARVSAALSSPQVAVTANNGPSLLEIPADFDYFQLSGFTTRYVAPGGNCGGATPCYATIQSAVDAAGDYDSIKVAAGAYTDLHARPRSDITTTGVVTQVVYISKTIGIEGGYTTTNWITPNLAVNLTTLDAQGQGRVIYITGDIAPVIEGLRITGGDAKGMGGHVHDRFGIKDSGGGIYIWEVPVALHNNWIYSNTATVGGGVYVNLDDPGGTIESNTIFSNTADGGGGLALTGSAARVTGNIIRQNYAWNSGGGLAFLMSSPTLQRNIITTNGAARQGGGIYFQWGDATLINNVIADNHLDDANWGKGSGLHVAGANPHLSHNTIARNTGGDGSGVYVVDLDWGQPTILMTNSILVSQSVGLSANGVSTVTVNGILWYTTLITVSKSVTAVVTVNNQITGNPAFAPDGYHLSLNSAAIDKGVNARVVEDIDGKPRPRGIGYDLGADEFWWEMVYLPLVLR